MCKNIIKVFVLFCIYVLLLGLSCQSLAGFRYDLTSTDIATIVDNYWTGNQATLYKSAFNTQYNNYKNQYDTVAVAIQTYSYGNIHLTFFNASQVYAIHNNKDVNYMSIQSTESIRYVGLTFVPGGRWGTDHIQAGTGLRESGVNTTFGSGSQLRTNYLLVTNSFLNFEGPWESSQLLGPFQNPIIWDFSPNDPTVIFVEGSPHEFHKIYKTSLNPPLGTISDSVWCDLISISYYYYDRSSNLWKIAYTKRPYNRDNDLSISDIFVTTVIDNIQFSIITVPNNLLVNDMIVEADFVSNNGDLDFIQTWSYVTSGFTVFSGDTVDIDNTFSGDYYIDYLDDINDIINNPTNEINSNLIDIQSTIVDNSLVGSIFDEYFSGDSGDIANQMGFVNYENPFLDFFDNIASSIKNILLSNGHNSVSFTMHGHTYTISADIFIIPNGILRTFVALLSNFIIILTIYKFLFNLFANIVVGELGPVYGFLKRNARGIANLL